MLCPLLLVLLVSSSTWPPTSPPECWVQRVTLGRVRLAVSQGGHGGGEQLVGQEPNSGGAAHRPTHRAGPLGQGEGQRSPCTQHSGTFSSQQDTMTGQGKERGMEKGESLCTVAPSPARVSFCAVYELLWLVLLGSHGEMPQCGNDAWIRQLQPEATSGDLERGRQSHADTGVREVVMLPGEGRSSHQTSHPACRVGQAAFAEMGTGV